MRMSVRERPHDELGFDRSEGQRAGKSPWVERFGRAGLVAKGALYAVVSILAIDVALGSRKESPDKNGALRTIAEQPFGKVLLIALAVGLAGYAVWQLSLAILDRENEGEDAKGLAKRATALARAGWYGVPLLADVVDAGRQREREQQRAAENTAGIFDHTGEAATSSMRPDSHSSERPRSTATARSPASSTRS